MHVSIHCTRTNRNGVCWEWEFSRTYFTSVKSKGHVNINECTPGDGLVSLLLGA